MTNGWKPNDAGILTALDDHKIAALRMGLATAALFIIYVDPTEPNRHFPITFLSLILYAAYSSVLYAIASRKKSFTWHVFVALEVADIALYTVLISLSSGTNSIFFSFYFFAVLVAGMRGGPAFGFGATTIATVLFSVFGYLSAAVGAFELNRFFMRPLTLLTLGYIVSYWAGAEMRLKKRLTLLKELSLTANPRLDVERIIARFMEGLLNFYNTDSCVLVLANAERSGYRLHRATRQERTAGTDYVEIENARDCPLLGLPPFAVGIYCEHSGGQSKSRIYRLCDLKSAETAQSLKSAAAAAEWMHTRAFITSPIRYRDKGLGRICLTSARPDTFNLDDASFLQQAVDQIIPVLENVRLVDRLASEASNHERNKIARSIHDRVIQPYLGLQLGLDAVRQSLRSELQQNSGIDSPANNRANKSVLLLEQLSAMTKDGVEELREYVYGLRRSDERQPRMVESIRRFAAQFSDVTGIDVAVVSRLTHNFISDSLATEVFQMVTEALSNVRRHTKANNVVVYLETVDNRLIVRCENDDCKEGLIHTFRPVSISDRAEALGGRAHVSSEDGCTRVQFEVPL